MAWLIVWLGCVSWAAAWTDELRGELLAMGERDQAVQMDPEANPHDAGHNDRIDAEFLRNATRLQALIGEHGWPTLERVGPDALEAAWLVVQHADHDVVFQQEMLDLMVASDSGLAGIKVAYLTDRVRVNQGLPQVYGTQMARDAKGRAIPEELEDAKHVDDRRAAVGLRPLKAAVRDHRRFERQMAKRLGL